MNSRTVFFWLAVPTAFALGLVSGRLPFAGKPETAVAPRVPEATMKKSPVAMAGPVTPQEAVVAAAKKPWDTIEQLKLVSEMNARLSSKFTITLLMGDTLNPDFVKMFGLTPAEEARLKEEIAAAKLRLAQLEASHATITPKGNGGLLVTILPFPTEGGEVFNAFRHALRDTLGPERFAYHEQMAGSGSQEDYTFGNFGLTDSVIYVKPTGEGSTTTSQWNSDQKTGLVTMRTEASLEYLKALRPELHKKLVAGGHVPVPPSGK